MGVHPKARSKGYLSGPRRVSRQQQTPEHLPLSDNSSPGNGRSTSIEKHVLAPKIHPPEKWIMLKPNLAVAKERAMSISDWRVMASAAGDIAIAAVAPVVNWMLLQDNSQNA